MADSLLQHEYKVYSEKYDIHGVIQDYGVVIDLLFYYEGKLVDMGLSRGIDTDFEKLGKELIESYVENLSTPKEKRKLELHYWWLSKRTDKHGSTYVYASGIVTGHERLGDSHKAETSEVIQSVYNKTEDEITLITRNSIYHCPLSYCDFDKQDDEPDLLPDYEALKKKYADTRPNPAIEPGKLLLVLADFSYYYFHSLYYIPKDSKDNKPIDYMGHAHVGTFQDSFLIQTEDCEVDLRYFPHYQNIEFYIENTDDCPLFIENIGSSVLYARTCEGTIKLGPGERKEVKEDNAEKDPPQLANGDLYPAGVF